MTNRYSSLVYEIGDTIFTGLTAKGLQQIEIEQHKAEAVTHLSNYQFEQAASALGEMADLIGEMEFPNDEALVRFGQARAYAKIPHQFQNAVDMCHMAMSLAEQVGNSLLRADVCQFLAKLEIAHENFSSALLSIAQAIDIYEVLGGQNENLMACYRVQGLLAGLLLQFSLSKISFTISLELSKMAGDGLMALEIEQLKTVMLSFENGELSASVLGQIFSAMVLFGRRDINAHRLLNSSIEELNRDNFAVAQKLAERSLDMGKVEQSADGFCRYLIASLVLAEIYDAQKSRISVLKVLLRCKSFAEKHFRNQDSNAFVKQYLDSFHMRWGKVELRQVVAKYYELATKRQIKEPH
ncbi:MAG: hypothetical protein AB8G95_08155 [Anaerolineae bacterium]